MKDESTNGVSSYMDFVSNAASYEAFLREEDDPLLSAETLAESSSMIDFKTFAREYPERLFPLIFRLRPEFQELFIEYWILQKSQAFIAKCHGFIQTRTWQNLRIIEQTIGSLILLGTNPDAAILQPILEKAGLETTPYGGLTGMILIYAENQSYTAVARRIGAPVPAVRKIFRPAITALLADKNIKAVAVGAYLRGLTHQASLTGTGLSKRCVARTRRVKTLRFNAPPSDDSPLISFGAVSSLRDTPWCMLEISSDGRMAQIAPMLRSYGKRLFGKKAAQIFAPINDDGELAFGYIFARSASSALVRGLTRVRGISEMSTVCDDEGVVVRAVTIPHEDVLGMMKKHNPAPKVQIRIGDFVRVLTGPASGYHGVIAEAAKTHVVVRVDFPTGRCFLIDAEPSSVVPLDIPVSKRRFWGAML